MIDDLRHRILLAATRVYAQHGSKGATTRVIAEEAGVNEVTIFRQFGSKDALLELVVREGAQFKAHAVLPSTPIDPEVELTEWAQVHYEGICAMCAMIRQIFSEAATRPDAVQCAKGGPSSALAYLREYIVRLRRHGWLGDEPEIRPSDVSAGVAMFMGALFNDAMNRDMMPELFPKSSADALRGYVRVFLRGVGVARDSNTLLESHDVSISSPPTSREFTSSECASSECASNASASRVGNVGPRWYGPLVGDRACRRAIERHACAANAWDVHQCDDR